MRYFFILALSLNFLYMNSQENLPFYEISNYPESYSEAEIVGRMIDGLGFRYYWATEGLTEEDLNFVEKEKINLENYDELISNIKNIKPDIIVHTAGLTNIEYCENNENQ